MKWLVDYSCHPGKLSPFSSPFAAPNDPLFYPLHNYYERVWAFRRHTTQGGPWNDSWGEGFDSSLGFGSYCQGFGYHDTLPFSSENINGEDSTYLYTNADLYDYYDPHNPDLPYVWDDFQWAHCPANLLEEEDPIAKHPSPVAPSPI
uniref:Tyrosinase copper-binding domain-containing protein n=1 Tax=Octactis speculum TaxID=3111310 RepID=A0A7S2E539_9STRA|mmetsp:Transcript_57876/g.78894  ORF Transcript_57876/g.78894 Transcript_57876/m.78894 type:complete len:147 (+) Transcript_57876:3-443(+)